MKEKLDPLTPQEEAVQEAKKRFGLQASTEDHINFRLIRLPIKVQGKTATSVTGMGPTWGDAINNLKLRIEDTIPVEFRPRTMLQTTS